MALPPTIQLVTVSFGPFLDFQGQPLAGSTRFEPSTPVNHAATGTPILNRPITVQWDEDGMGLIVLPATDSVGLDVTGFTYRVRHTFSDSTVPAPPSTSIQLPAAAPNVDLDLLIPVSASNGVVVSVPGVASVAGLTGTVTAEQLAAAGVGTSDDAVADLVGTAGSQTALALRAAYVPLAQLATNPDMLITGAITRDGNGAATAAPVVWPDGDPGQYSATTLSSAFPGAVDAYTITKGSPVKLTFTQPTMTRDGSGSVVQRPALTVA